MKVVRMQATKKRCMGSSQDADDGEYENDDSSWDDRDDDNKKVEEELLHAVTEVEPEQEKVFEESVPS